MGFVYKKEIGCRVYDPPLIQRYDLQDESYSDVFVECQESLTFLFDKCVVENKQKSAIPGEGAIVYRQLINILDTIGLPFTVGCEYLTRFGKL